MLKHPNRLGHYIEQPAQPQEQQPAQLQPQPLHDPSWAETGEMPAVKAAGLSTWDKMQQAPKIASPITPIHNWHAELPKPRYQRDLPVFRETFDFDKFSARVMKVTVIIFAFLFLLVCLLRALIQFAFMK